MAHPLEISYLQAVFSSSSFLYVSLSPPHLLLCFSLKNQIQYPSAVFILAHIWGKFSPSTYSLCLYIYFLGVLKGLIGLKTYNWLDSDHRNVSSAEWLFFAFLAGLVFKVINNMLRWTYLSHPAQCCGKHFGNISTGHDDNLLLRVYP